MKRQAWLVRALENAPLMLFGCVLVAFGLVAPKFLTPENLLNVCIQAAPTGVVAIGMTFVLLTAGVDLSVGAIMFVAGAVAGKLALAGQPMALVLVVMVLIGTALGALNGLIITRLKVTAFIVTLAMLFIGRGFSLWLTQTRAMNLPDEYLNIGSSRLLGVPTPLAVLVLIALIAQAVLRRTAPGRQIYAVGHNVETARKAGVPTQRLLAAVYIVSGLCATVGALLSLGQLGAVTPKFGENYEFKAIAAAVLGGTSLFGGRGAVLPGTILGALLIQCVENGLVLLNADPYLYPLITSAVIFTAVLLDSLRQRLFQHLTRPKIRVEEPRLSRVKGLLPKSSVIEHW